MAAFVAVVFAFPSKQLQSNQILQTIDSGFGLNNILSLTQHVSNWVAIAESAAQNTKKSKSSKQPKKSPEDIIKIVDETLQDSKLVPELFQDIFKTIQGPDNTKKNDTFLAKRNRAIEAAIRALDTIFEWTKSKTIAIKKDHKTDDNVQQSQSQILAKTDVVKS